MIISATLLKHACDNYQREGFAMPGQNGGGIRRMDASMEEGGMDRKNQCILCLVVAIVILIIEVSVLYFALDIAINTTVSGPERYIHVFLALFLTMPYLLLSVLFSADAKALLRSNPGLAGKASFGCGMPSSSASFGCGMPPPAASFGCGMPPPAASFGFGSPRKTSRRSSQKSHGRRR